MKSKSSLIQLKYTLALLLASSVFISLPVRAQTLMLKFDFNDSGATTTDSVNGVSLNLLNYSGAATDLHGAVGTGVNGVDKCLDLTAAETAGAGDGPIAQDVGDTKINFGTLTNYTIVFWLKPVVGGAAYYPRWFGLGANGVTDVAANNAVALISNNSDTSAQVGLNSSNYKPTLSPALVEGAWNFLACTYDGTNLLVYTASRTNSVTAGVVVATTANQAVNIGSTFSLMLGNRISNRQRGGQACYDAVRFYAGAASQSFLEGVRETDIALAAGTTTFSPASPVYVGATVTLSTLIGGGAPPYTYDWQESTDGGATYSTDLGSGNGDGTYALNTSSQGDTTRYYRLIVTDHNGAAVTNTPAALSVTTTQTAPTLASDTTITPSTAFAGVTTAVTMSAAFHGVPLSYQWQYSDLATFTNDLPGATNATYVIARPAQYGDAGNYRLVAYNSAGTNQSSFAALAVQMPVTISAGAVGLAPTISTLTSGTYDIAQLDSTGDSKFPDANGLNYYDNNGTKPGQTFTTGSNPAGYALGDLYYLCGGPVVSDGNHAAGTVYTLRIYSLTNAFAGTATLVSTYTNQNVAAALPNDVWAHWTGLTNVLAPNSAYAYSISAGSGYMHMGNCSNSPAPYAGGQLVLLPTATGAGTFGTGAAANTSATFLLPLVPAGYPWVEDIGMSTAGATLTNNGTVLAGNQVVLTATAIGTNIGYAWQLNGSPLPNSDSPQYTLDTTALPPGVYSVSVVVTNASDTSTSASVSFNVVAGTIASVNISPANSGTNPVYAGTPVTLSASGVQGMGLTYSWQTDNGIGNWTDIPNSNTNVYVVDTSTLSAGIYQYQLKISNASGSVTSPALTLNLAAASGPVLSSGATASPSVVIVGNSATFTAGFAGSQPMTYQWYFDNGSGAAAISGATNASYTLNNAQITNAGSYYLQAANHPPGLGTQTASSAMAMLYVVPAPDTNTSTARISDGGASPYVGDYDISQLTDAQIAPSGINYYVDNTANPPGQIFTTGSALPSGMSAFPLNYVYFKHDASVAGSGNTTVQSYTLRVYRMLDGTNAQLLTSYVTTNAIAFTAGDWIRIDGLTNLLAPNATYAISLARNGSGYWRMACTVYGSPGPNGQACLTPVSGGAVSLSSPDPAFGYYYDAAYVAGLTPPTAPVLLSDTVITPPSVYNGQGPVVMTASFTGQQPISYQWQHDGTNIIGATNTTYTIPQASYADAGSYSLLASNSLSGGSPTASSSQTLTVSTPPTTTFVADFAYWNTHPGAASPGYSGPGVVGAGTTWNRPVPGTATSTFNGTIATLCQNPAPAVADDGSDLGAMTFTTYATKTDDYYWYSTVPAGEITLLDTFMDNQSTNAIPFAFSNLFNGCYNLVLFGENGRNTSSRVTFAVNGASQTVTNTSASLNQFVLNNNYVVFSNIAVTNGVILGTWSNPDGSTSAAFNGAQLQMAYSAENPQIFISSQPADMTVISGHLASLSVTAEGPGTNWLPGPLFYQWWNAGTGTPITGATNNTYAVDTSTAGTSSYYAVITNLTGLGINSRTATVTVYTPDTLKWLGSSGPAWDLSTPNWFDVTTASSGNTYADPELVVFDDTASSFVVSNATTVSPSGVLVNNFANDYVFTGTGSMSGGMSLTKTGASSLIISNNQSYTGGTIVNQGTLVLAKGGAAGSIAGALTVNPDATVSLRAADALGYSGSFVTTVSLNGGTLDNATTGNEAYDTSFNLMGGAMSSSGGGAYNFDGAVSINSLATNVPSVISARMALRANGLVINTASGAVPGGIDLSIAGAISDAGGNQLIKNGDGTLSLSGANTFNGDITLNAGTLRIDGSGTLNGGNYTAQIHNNGALLDYASSAAQSLGVVSGAGPLTIDGPGILTLNSVNSYAGPTTVNGGTLAGIGVIASSVTVNSGATLAPGSGGSGLLTLNGNLILNAGSTSTFAVNGSTAAATSIAAGGAITYGGTLQLVPSGAFAGGQQFILFSGAGAVNTGNFASISGSPGTGLAFSFTNGVLSVVSTSVAGPIQLTNSVSGNTLSLSWPAGQALRLQAQTNGLSSGGWFYLTDGSASSATITIDPTQPSVFYRLSQ